MDLAVAAGLAAGAARFVRVYCWLDGAAGGRGWSDPASSGVNDHVTFLEQLTCCSRQGTGQVSFIIGQGASYLCTPTVQRFGAFYSN